MITPYSAYEYTPKALLDVYRDAVAKAAVSNSGLVISIGAESDRGRVFYLNGIILSKLEGQKPPFNRGEEVRTMPSRPFRVQSVNMGPGYISHFIEPDETHEISQIFYEGAGKWTLKFKDTEDFRFPTDYLEKVEPANQLANS